MKQSDERAAGTEAMGMAAFLTLLEQYGAEPGRWPDALRVPAGKLLEMSLEARGEHQRAAILDAMMDTAEAPVVSEARVARVVAGALTDLPVPGLVRRRTPFAQRLGDWLAPVVAFWPRAAGLAACTVAGIAVGTITPATTAAHYSEAGVSVAATTSVEDLPSALLTPSPIESLFQ